MQIEVVNTINVLLGNAKKITQVRNLRPDSNWDQALDALYSVAKADANHINITIVSPRHAGLGDVMFGAKLAELIQRCYPEANIILITNDTHDLNTIELIKKLKIDKEYAINIMSADSYQKLLNNNELVQPDLIIEAPVFSILENNLYKSLSPKIPVLLISEYSIDSNLAYSTPSADQMLNSGAFNNKFHEIYTLNTGLNSINESGIFIEDRLAQRVLSQKNEWKKINLTLRKHILQSYQSLNEYKNLTNLSFAYAHNDYYRLIGGFVEFVKYSGKNADMILISDNMEKCSSTIDKLKNVFIKNGFNKIILYNIYSNEKEVTLYNIDSNGNEIDINEQSKNLREFRIILTKQLTHQEIISLHLISGPYKGATGDQTLSECISCFSGAIINYEVFYHKVNLVINLRLLAEKFAEDKNIPNFAKVIKLLTWRTNDGEFDETKLNVLGDLIRDPIMQQHIYEFNKMLRTTFDLEYAIFLRINRILLNIKYPFLKEKFQEIQQKNTEEIISELSFVFKMITNRDEFFIECSQPHENHYANKIFLEAAQQGDHEKMLTALKLGANVNVKNSDGNSALDLAIRSDNFSLINSLCSVNGIDLNILNNEGLIPLYASLLSSKFEIAILLLTKGADPNIYSINGFITGNALHYLITNIQKLDDDKCNSNIQKQYLKILDELLEHGLELIADDIESINAAVNNDISPFKKNLLTQILNKAIHELFFKNLPDKKALTTMTKENTDSKAVAKSTAKQCKNSLPITNNNKHRNKFFLRLFGKEFFQPMSENTVTHKKNLC